MPCARSIFGWLAQVFRDSGYSAHDAGLLLGVTTAISIPLSFVIPAQTARIKDQRVLLTAIMVFYPIGYLGLVAAPDHLPWVWAATLGVGTCTFPFILTLIGLRARTPAGTAALSGFTQSVGYLIAATGPIAVGALHDATGSWTPALATVIALDLALVCVGYLAGRNRVLQPVGGAAPLASEAC